MTKKNTKVLIPAGAQVTEVVEIEDTTPKTVDMQALVAMGVDMKLSKNDIIEYAAEMMAEKVKERLETSDKALKDIKDSFMAEVNKRSELAKTDSEFVKFVETYDRLRELCVVNYHASYASEVVGIPQLVVQAEGSDTMHDFCYQSLLSNDDHQRTFSLYMRLCYGGLRSKHVVKLMDPSEIEAYRVARLEARALYAEAYESHQQLESATKKVRIELTKAILQNSDKGRELLNFLDSSSKTRLKALASKNA